MRGAYFLYSSGREGATDRPGAEIVCQSAAFVALHKTSHGRQQDEIKLVFFARLPPDDLYCFLFCLFVFS